MNKADFERRVAETVDSLPDWVRRKMDNVAVVAEDRPSKALCRLMGIAWADGLLGLFEGPSRLEREAGESTLCRVVLYRRMIEDEAGGDAGLSRVIRETLAHELGHYFGMDDAAIEEFEEAWERARKPG